MMLPLLGLIYLGVLLNIGSTSFVQFHQTVPDPGVVPCPGDRLVLECVTDAGTGSDAIALWSINNGGSLQLDNESRTQSSKDSQPRFTFNVTMINGSIMKSVAITDEPVNGTIVSCRVNSMQFVTLDVNVTGPPVIPVSEATVEPINNNILIINWTEQQQCIDHYNVTINSNNTHNESRTTNNNNITINDLIIGTNYSFIIIPIDTIGREGPPSSLIQYIWNVPAQVVNIKHEVSIDNSITIWWNNTEDDSLLYPPVHYVISVLDDNYITYSNSYSFHCNYEVDPCYVTIIPVNIIGYGPSATVNVGITFTITSSSVHSAPSSVTLSNDISTSITLIHITSTSIVVSSTIHEQSSSFISATSTSTGTTSMSTPDSATTVSTTASGSNAVAIISGAIGTVFVIIIIIIIIILIILLVYAKRYRIKKKESHTANGNGNESKGVTGSSYRNNNIELVPTDPTYATPTTEYTPAAASTVRTLQGGDGPPSYPPPPPTGQYSVLRANDDDDDTPPPVPAYNPNGVQEYSELRREGEKKNKQQQQQQQQHGAGPVYSTLNQEDTPPPVPPAYNPEGVQEYSVLKREGENKGQQGLSAGATGLYSTINKDTNNQVVVDESAHKPVYADLAIAAKGKRPAAAPTQEQPVLYASVNNKSVPPPIPPPAAPDKVLYADLSIAAGKRTPKNKPPTEERVVYAAVNGNRKSTTQELIMDRLGGLDIPPPIPPKPKP